MNGLKEQHKLQLDGYPDLSINIGFLFNVCYCYIKHRIENVFKKVKDNYS